MGQEKEFRPVYVPGLTCSTDATFETDVTVSQEFKQSVAAASATSSSIPAYGISTIASTSSTKTFNLASPSGGVMKQVIASNIASTGTAVTIIPASTSVVFVSTAGSTSRKATLAQTGDAMFLAGTTSNQWLVIGHNGVVFAGT